MRRLVDSVTRIGNLLEREEHAMKSNLLCLLITLVVTIGFFSCGGSGGNQEECPQGFVDWLGECLPDGDLDGLPDAHDNCPQIGNPDQEDSDDDGIGDACEEEEEKDSDDDGFLDEEDNCPAVANPDQADWDADGTGDACTLQDGTIDHPFIIPVAGSRVEYSDARDTSDSPSDIVDSYPPNELDESGPEFFYVFRLELPMTVSASIDFPEPEGTDIDLHILSSFEPLELVARDHYSLLANLEPGIYYLVMDTYVSDGVEMPGPYDLRVEMNETHAGTIADPISLGEPAGQALPAHYVFSDIRDTTLAESDSLDSYPPNELDESGPEYIYIFELGQPSRVTAELVCPEPEGVDIDVHLLASLEPVELLARDDRGVYAELGPGTYFLSLDTYAGGGTPATGTFALDFSVRPMQTDPSETFNDYVLAAVELLYQEYGLLGYASAALTHDIPYGDYGVVEATDPPRTMCVAAALEVILTAMQVYEDNTGDSGVWDFLPITSFSRLGSSDLRGHVWVNHDLNAGGTADAVRHFGMGMTVPFEQLQPGSFINLNRTNGTGHAVVFLAFIDINGSESATWHENVVGFKYFSSQGGYDAGYGGLDYRYAVFDEYGEPSMPYNRDLHIIYSEDQLYLNTGMIYHPDLWLPTARSLGLTPYSLGEIEYTEFDADYFDGRTFDDPDR